MPSCLFAAAADNSKFMITISNFNADAYDNYRRDFLSMDFSANTGARGANSADTRNFERETFLEYAATVFSEDIGVYITQTHDASEYKNFITSIFTELLNINADDPVVKLLKYLENESDFFSCPASTKHHSNEPYGLIRHSLLVYSHGLKLAPVMLSGNVDMYYLTVSCLFHDLCKVNMYEMKTRNVKNEETGNWEKAPYYRVKDSYLSYGHGVESMLRLNKYIAMPDPWNQAVRWHMGAYDISPLDKVAIDKALFSFREVLFLHTADMLSVIDEDV